jgi:mRNA-degrading endonuclease RelE of RelBE toxin-antitoxin system
MASGAAWAVSVLPAAQREMDGLDDSMRFEALEAITDLEEDPFPAGSILLRGYTDLHRLKFYRDQFRVVYTVSEKQRRIIVERVRTRSTAYAGLRDPGI